ncbi:DEAD/DEAH box helicase family protein [Leptolyngbya sp. CCY15150]|uniref:DEAD/DEAH box helicase family protein n=1 Tax=Leptolyngbya sp. CCY15150 TaxID=2767772 RepID=UPI00194FB06C|nr:DEAD/DEAH box helicase family protein [Leptolyngbya sp. CCY15150]
MPPTNFAFLRPAFPTLYNHATHAERLIYAAPRASCFYTRFALEQTVLWLYENDPNLRLPYENSLSALIHEPSFKRIINPGLFPKIRLIQQLGNKAVHQSRDVQDDDAIRLIQELFHILYWLARTYSRRGCDLPNLIFDRANIPQPADPNAPTQADLKTLEQQLSETDSLRRIEADRRQKTEAELDAARAEIAALRQANEAATDPHDYNEAETRRLLIDVLLREAGWNPSDPNATEVEVQGMPTPDNGNTGRGFVDYVLWGDDGKPLAIVEAKRTSTRPEVGKHQAKLYADCLEQRYGQRPLIFYSNGYETWLWDDRAYPPRQVLGFLKKDELERIIFRRTHRKRLSATPINEAIAGRPYQTEAIRRITETLEAEQCRKALLVKATGTGKTRTAIALVDLLKRANWVRRVLFLADRKSLVRQAYRAFKTHLPTVTPINLLLTKDISGGDVILSTYPTILNAINRTDDGDRPMGVGYFDLVIVDEAHRSIYKKYGEIFDYFDAFLIGLTATPRSEVDRDTYRIFELQQGVPTFAYELDDAVNDGHLVPPKGVDVPFKFLRTGIKYSDLSPDEQLDYEEKFRDETGAIPTEINAAALNQWLFNIETVDKALEVLMQRGLKVNSGDRLGKTIIFARNHAHAQFICDRFNASYPHYNGHFAQVIDSQNPYSETLLDDFSDPNKDPAIAISVDMLDTGVDVPEVVNLVFFKPVFSRVKFNQMIGRGTRLCPDLFGPDQPKTHFLVFDLCGNFEYFSQTIPETDQKLAESLTTRLVKHRLELAVKLTEANTTPDPASSPLDALRTGLLDDLHRHVDTMPRENFIVRRHLEPIESFANRDRWNALSDNDITTIAETLAPLPNGLPNEDPLAKEFDLLCLKLQLAILKTSGSYERLRDRIRDILSVLETKPDIPMINAHLAFIQAVQEEQWWSGVTLPMVEEIRQRIRDLVKFIERQQQKTVITDFADELGEVQDVDVPTYQTGFSPYQYRKKVEAYIHANENHVAIAKLKRNTPLTDADLSELEAMLFAADEIESRERFETVFGKTKSLKRLIREIVGLDRIAAKAAFATYLEGTTLSANQIRFIENIIDYLTQHGIMDPGMLYESPYTDTHPEGLDGLFRNNDADNIISIIEAFNTAVDVDFSEDAASA